jgi:restriction system protein
MQKKTIRDAIIEVMKMKGKPLTSKETYEAIIEAKVYKFNSASPESLVAREIRTHCEGLDLKTSKKEKYFKEPSSGRYFLKE